MNYSTKRTLSLISGLMMSFFLCTSLNLNAQMEKRVETGALLELKGKIWSGAGQAGVTGFDGFESYWSVAPANQKPALFMDYYDTYNIGPKWTHELKQELLKFHRQGYYVIPQIGLNLDYFWQDIVAGKHEKELDNLVKGFQYLGIPVFLRIGYEFNNQKSWPANDYIKIYQIITDKLRAGGVEVATVFNAGLSGNQGVAGFYPGSDYVDWVGYNTFSWDISGGNHTIIHEFLNLAGAENKPIMIGEASPTAVNQVTYNNWNGFYETYFSMIEQRGQIKQMCYINWSWDIQDMVAGNGLFPWGDSRLNMPGSVKDQFFARMNKPEYFFATSEENTRKLFFYNDNAAPSTPSGLTVSGENIVWNGVSDSGEAGLAHYTIYKDGQFWDYVTTPEYPVADLGYGDVANVQVLAMDRAGNASALSSGLAVQMNDRYELIYDGEFDMPSTSWGLDWQWKGSQDGGAKPAPDDITGNLTGGGILSGENCIKLTWDKRPNVPADWKIQLMQHFQVVKDEVYTISFMAKAEKPVTFKLKFMDHAPHWDCTHFPAGVDPNFSTEWQIYDEWEVSLTTEPQTYTFVTTSPETETARLSFMFGHLDQPVVVYVDAVSVSAGTGSILKANAGPDITVEDPEKDGADVTLDGSASQAINGKIVDYTWEIETIGTRKGVTQTVNLPIGQYKATLTVTDEDGATDSDEVTIKVLEEYVPPREHTPYQGKAQVIPGLIEAEHFDEGGEGKAYHDTDNNNAGGQVRPSDGVDVGANPHAVGWTANGEWLKYTVEVTPGTYRVDARVASEVSNPGDIKVSLSENGKDFRELTTIDVTNTGGWNTWEVVSKTVEITEEAYDAVLLLDIINGSLNVDWLEFVTVRTAKKALSADEIKQIRIYPNPVEKGSVLTIEGIDNNQQYQVINIEGKAVLSGKGNKLTVPSLESGKYFILLNNNKKTYQFMVK